MIHPAGVDWVFPADLRDGSSGHPLYSRRSPRSRTTCQGMYLVGGLRAGGPTGDEGGPWGIAYSVWLQSTRGGSAIARTLLDLGLHVTGIWFAQHGSMWVPLAGESHAWDERRRTSWGGVQAASTHLTPAPAVLNVIFSFSTETAK